MNRLACAALIALAAAALPACSSAKIAALEQLGFPKREQLVDRVEDARDSQKAAKKQFASTLEEFLAVTGSGSGGAKGGDLERMYARLKSAFERSKTRAESVRDRIRSVERVAGALFEEWKDELKQYESDSLRRASQRQLDATRDRYEQLLAAMKAAESRMAPVLAAFNDQVLFLKHNLNAQAIASLQNTALEIESDVQGLIDEMNAAIAEADAFIAEINAAD